MSATALGWATRVPSARAPGPADYLAAFEGNHRNGAYVPAVDVSPWALREGIMLHYLEDPLAESWSLPLQPVTPDPAHPPNLLDLPHRQESLEHDRR